MPHWFTATLKRQPVELGVTNAEKLKADEALRAAMAVLADASPDDLRRIASERGITFHPSTTAETMRRRLIGV